VIVTATFRNNAGALANPTTVDVDVKYPSGTTATPVASNVSTGVYSIPIGIDEVGIIYYGVTGAGNNADAYAEGSVCGVASSL